MDELTLIGAPGTNKVMAGELSRLVGRALSGERLPQPRKSGTGGLTYPWDDEVARVAATYHRTCARVLRDRLSSTAARLEPLYDDLVEQVAASADWLADGATISVQARRVVQFAAGERQIVGTVKNALVDGAARRGAAVRVDPDHADLEISVRLHEGTITVAIDLGGPMHMRGYRTNAGPAPLRETMAATLVMLSRHDSRREVFLDPMAGSGTIAIEAALMARAMPVRVGSAAPPLFADTEPVVFANELDPRMADASRDHAGVAGVGDFVRVRSGDARAIDRADLPDGPGVIVCNPPYGERIGADLETLYAEIGEWLRQFGGWRACFLVANPNFEDLLGIRPRIKKPLSVHPLKGYFYLYDL
jgi:23S rRNA G2445 N2-methylase RlmL